MSRLERKKGAHVARGGTTQKHSERDYSRPVGRRAAWRCSITIARRINEYMIPFLSLPSADKKAPSCATTRRSLSGEGQGIIRPEWASTLHNTYIARARYALVSSSRIQLPYPASMPGEHVHICIPARTLPPLHRRPGGLAGRAEVPARVTMDDMMATSLVYAGQGMYRQVGVCMYLYMYLYLYMYMYIYT